MLLQRLLILSQLTGSLYGMSRFALRGHLEVTAVALDMCSINIVILRAVKLLVYMQRPADHVIQINHAVPNLLFR